MRLYLSSYRVPVADELFKLIGKKPAEVKMVLIGNAKDEFIPRIWELKNQEARQFFLDLGVGQCDIIDLKKFDANSVTAITSVLQTYDLVWANGGNTFMLLYEMRRSGFNKAIRTLLENDTLVYGGESAGQLVAGPSISGTELADNPNFAEEMVTEGMNLTDEYIFPHADNPIFAEALADFRSKHRTIVELKDSEAIIINGNQRKKK